MSIRTRIVCSVTNFRCLRTDLKMCKTVAFVDGNRVPTAPFENLRAERPGPPSGADRTERSKRHSAAPMWDFVHSWIATNGSEAAMRRQRPRVAYPDPIREVLHVAE